MSKPSSNPAPRPKTAEPLPPAGGKPSQGVEDQKPPLGHPQDAGRETVESIAFAFVLALLFRTFVAEAFVIPTGSMAPTLFGRNKDVVCTECKYNYQIGASDELDDDGYLIGRVDESICPNCRHLNKVRDLPVFKGDRILVNKFTYQVGSPERWDVIVFRYPEDPQKNYIKRLIGLPGESIRINRGDLYARQGNSGEFHILRKQNPYKQKVLQQLVYDDHDPPVDLLKAGWPERWTSMSAKEEGGKFKSWEPDSEGWKHDAAARSFSIEKSDQTKWVRYQHVVPSRNDWRLASDGDNSRLKPLPQLITDFCGYNSYSGARSSSMEDDRFWVGDLTLNCTLEITSVDSKGAEVVFELVEGVRRYRCQIDVTTGMATLFRNDELATDPSSVDVKMASAQTPIKGPGQYTIAYANVDDRVCLWVNNGWFNSGLIPFGSDAEFTAPENRSPQDADLNPVGFATKGLSARVSKLLLERDIYYRAESVPNTGYDSHEQEIPSLVRIRESFSDPAEYADLYQRNAREAVFKPLGSDEFFAMGDNSPRSMDSRLWPNQRNAENRHAVSRQALLGKAFFIYWPHGIPFLNGGKGFKIKNHSVGRNFNNEPLVETYPEYVAPFYPQWWRWKRIR